MRLKNLFLIAIIAINLLVSCKKSSPSDPNSKNSTGVDVYVAGYINPLWGQSIATYWKNGVPVKLTDSIVTIASATGIVVLGNDIYVSGNTSQVAAGIDNHTAAYWKNGIETQLLAVQSAYSLQHIDALYSVASGIAVQDNNVYVVGSSTPTVASLWINGVLTKLADDSYYSHASAITLQGSDVYIGGTTSATGYSVATYWKNGVPTTVSGNTPSAISVANAMAVNGSDVYLAGFIFNGYGETVAAYWKNGVATILGATNLANTNTAANGIYINGNDVYVTGNGANGAIYWKNGVATPLVGQDANAILFQGGNIYLVGSSYNKVTDGATVWDNSIPQIIGPPTSNANAIVVVPH